MTESDERLARLIENDVYATYHEWAKYLETPTEQLRVTVQDNDYGDGQPMRVELDGHGLFEVSVSVKRLPEIPVDVPARADWLAEGDQIFSDATGQWHEVISASTHGTTTLVIDRNNGSTFQFKIRPEQIFKARRGPASLLTDALGGEVIHSA